MLDLEGTLVSKKWSSCTKNDSGRPSLVAVVCSLKCFGNYL